MGWIKTLVAALALALMGAAMAGSYEDALDAAGNGRSSTLAKLLARGENIDAVLDALSRGLTQKMLHGAMAELRTADADARRQASSAVQHFFLRKER